MDQHYTVQKGEMVSWPAAPPHPPSPDFHASLLGLPAEPTAQPVLFHPLQKGKLRPEQSGTWAQPCG